MTYHPEMLDLTHMLDCIASIEDLTASGYVAFEASAHNRAAILYYLLRISHTSERLPDALKAAHPEIDWTTISRTPHYFVHDLYTVPPEWLWSTLEQNLAELRQGLRAMIESFDDPEAT